MAPDFEQAIHLVSSDSAAGLVKRAGATKGRVHTSTDLLTIGPCDVDPERHLTLRRAWNAEVWGQAFGLEDLRAAIAGDLPVVLWGTRAFADLVWLWWAMDGLGRIRPDLPLVFARPRPGHPLESVGGATLEQAQAALAAASSIQDGELREGAELWRQYASPSPLVFDEARRRGSSVFPELSESSELHGAWFPRLKGGRLRLAELDELLLGRLSDTWCTTWDLLAEMPGRERLLWPFGGLYPVVRLRAWAAHGAVAREARSDDNPLEQDAFRLTDRTRTLIAQGLEGVGDAPPLYIGGCLVNDPEAPWVRVDDDSGWRLAPHGHV